VEQTWRVHGDPRTVYDNPWIRLERVDVELPSGRRFPDHHVITLRPAAMVVVVNDDTDVLLSWRHRFVGDIWNYELPGGLIEDGEAPEHAAEREVLEETGYRPLGLRHLVSFEPVIGMMSAAHHVFLADGAQRVSEPSDLDEGRFEWVKLADVPAMITAGEIRNSGTLVGLLHYLALRGGE